MSVIILNVSFVSVVLSCHSNRQTKGTSCLRRGFKVSSHQTLSRSLSAASTLATYRCVTSLAPLLANATTYANPPGLHHCIRWYHGIAVFLTIKQQVQTGRQAQDWCSHTNTSVPLGKHRHICLSAGLHVCAIQQSILS